MAHAISTLGRALSRTGAALTLLGLVGAVPTGLVLTIGWPLPTTIPSSTDAWRQLLTAPIPDSAILHLLACAGWLLWAAFARAVWVEAKAAWRGVQAPTRLRFHPMRAAAAFLIAAVTAGNLALAAVPVTATPPRPAAAAPLTVPAPTASAIDASQIQAPPDPPSTLVLVSAQAPLLPAGHGVLAVNGCEHLYTVVAGDSLWHIAQLCLGDGNRWPQIWDLNKGRFWPSVSGYTRLHDPDLIYPRWTLTLPAGVQASTQTPQVAPVDPTPAPTTTTPTQTPAPSPSPASTPVPSATPTAAVPVTTPTPSASTNDPDGVVANPGSAAASAPAPAGTATSSGTPTPSPSPASDGGVPHVDGTGIALPSGSWIPWALAGALVAAMAVVWLQRRRRYIPRPLDGSAADERDTPAPAPAVLRQVQALWRNRTRTDGVDPLPPSPTAQPAPLPPPPTVAVPDVPLIDPLPPGGLGLLGPGAEAAARGALVAALAAGAPTDPDARTEVVIPLDAMVTLLGADAITLGTWARLRVTASLDEALALLEERLLFAARILDEHHVDDVTTLQQVAQSEQPVPPMLLIAATPPPGIRARTRMILGLGVGVQVSAVLLGDWAHGATVRVDPDGTCHHQGPPTPLVPDRMAVLDESDAYQLLATLREAHTGEPGPTPHLDPADRAHGDAELDRAHNDEKTRTAPADADETDADEKRATVAPGRAHEDEPFSAGDAEQTEAPRSGSAARAQVRVLGRPDIVGRPPEETMRSYCTDVMVYLAVHADGATPDQILDDLWPDERRRTTAIRLHTGLSNLRALLAKSVGSSTGGFVLRHHGRYRLNPDLLDVDLWRLRAGHAAARVHAGSDDAARIEALRQACQAYTAPLHDGRDSAWIEPYREGARAMAIDVHTALAAALADTDPAQAARLLDAAIAHDPANEQIYQQAMRAHHRFGDADAIRSLLRQLTLALGELDVQPGQDTLDLADRLRRDLEARRRPAA